MNKIKFIREKCIEVNPKIMTNNTSMLLEGEFHGIINHRDKTVRLADVLMALEKNQKDGQSFYLVSAGGGFWKVNQKDGMEWCKGYSWNLKNNNLENQLEETIDFIYDILKG